MSTKIWYRYMRTLVFILA